MRGFFITGTDTDCGKTTISLGLMAALQRRGLRVLGMKPVATGATCWSEVDLAITSWAALSKKFGVKTLKFNSDALQLLAQGSTLEPYELINPYLFVPPIAPHLAAAQINVTIDANTIITAYNHLATRADRIIVEGVGGWRVPLAPNFFLSDLAVMLQLPVIVIIGLKLGCINHALLTIENIRASGAPIHGWIANQIDPNLRERDGILATLTKLITAPCLGIVPWLDAATPQQIADYLRIER